MQYYAYKTHVRDKQSYALLPLTSEAVFADGMYYSEECFLLLLSKNVKERFQMVPKLDASGKMLGDRNDPTKPKQERILMQTADEFYISNPTDIEWFATTYVVNAQEFITFDKASRDEKLKKDQHIVDDEKVSALTPQEISTVVAASEEF